MMRHVLVCSGQWETPTSLLVPLTRSLAKTDDPSEFAPWQREEVPLLCGAV